MEAYLNKHDKNMIEYNVKHYGFKCDLPKDIDHDAIHWLLDDFVYEYADLCFKEIQRLGYKWTIDYWFKGRSAGWFCVETSINLESVNKWRQIDRITAIVERYYMNFDNKFKEYLEGVINGSNS